LEFSQSSQIAAEATMKRENCCKTQRPKFQSEESAITNKIKALHDGMYFNFQEVSNAFYDAVHFVATSFTAKFMLLASMTCWAKVQEFNDNTFHS